MDRWDVLIYAAAVYVAATSLVRMMANRRNELIEQVREQVEGAKPAKRPVEPSAEKDAA